MKRFVCELCGSNSLRKNGNAFVCSECGVSYTLEEARSLLIDVSHSDNDTATTNDHMTQRNEGIEVGGEMPCAEPGEPGIEIAEESDVTDVVNMRISEPDSPRTPSVSEVVTHEETLEHMNGDEIEEATQNNQQGGSVPLAPLTVRFGWVGGKMLPRVFDGDEQLPYNESFIKPETESTTDFCKRVAEMIESDLGRPVKYIVPKAEQQQKQKKGKKGRMGCLPIVVGIVLSSMLYQSCSGSSTSGSYSTSSTSRITSTRSNSTYTRKNSSSSSFSGYQKQETAKSSGTSISSYINSSEFSNLRIVLDTSSDNLMELLTSGNTAEIKSRISSISSALSSFLSVDTPDECIAMRDSYRQAANDMIEGLNIMNEILTTSGDHNALIIKAKNYFELATANVRVAVQELNRLKKLM